MHIEIFGVKKILNILDRQSPGVENLISVRDSLKEDDSANQLYAALDRRIRRHGINAKVIAFADVDRYRWGQGLEHPVVMKNLAEGEEPIFFTVEMAKDIMRWVHPLWEANHDVHIAIHCWAGRSRSQAIGYYLNTHYNLVLNRDIGSWNENNIANLSDKVHFNCDVLRIMTQASLPC